MARRFMEREERGVVAPSRVMLIAVVAVAIAGAVFITTSPQPEQAARVVASTTTPSATPTPTPSATPSATPTRKAPKKKRVVVKRGDTIVVVFNNVGARLRRLGDRRRVPPTRGVRRALAARAGPGSGGGGR